LQNYSCLIYDAMLTMIQPQVRRTVLAVASVAWADVQQRCDGLQIVPQRERN
jgi:hypothetical protein